MFDRAFLQMIEHLIADNARFAANLPCLFKIRHGILWTFLTSFKSELDAIAMPPKFLFFHWTLENYLEVQSRSNYLRFASNSIILSIGANIVGLIIAVPAAWSMAFAPGRWTKDLLMWMLSTKMMPAVGV